jgi:hypothetical protein
MISVPPLKLIPPTSKFLAVCVVVEILEDVPVKLIPALTIVPAPSIAFVLLLFTVIKVQVTDVPVPIEIATAVPEAKEEAVRTGEFVPAVVKQVAFCATVLIVHRSNVKGPVDEVARGETMMTDLKLTPPTAFEAVVDAPEFVKTQKSPVILPFPVQKAMPVVPRFPVQLLRVTPAFVSTLIPVAFEKFKEHLSTVTLLPDPVKAMQLSPLVVKVIPVITTATALPLSINLPVMETPVPLPPLKGMQARLTPFFNVAFAVIASLM